MTRHLIIGGGPAAINAIETIRDIDGGASEITLVCDEPAYSRMVLPYWLAQRIPRQHVFTGDDDYFRKLKVDLLIGAPVAKVDPQAKQATLADGRALPFDDVLIATGSSPVKPPIAGADLPGVLPLWTLAHTEAVLQATASIPRPEVVFIGAGFIGFIVLNAMHKRGWKLHVVEVAPHVLPHMLNEQSALLVERWLEKKDVSLHLGTTAQSIADVAGRKRVTLANGKTIDGDLVIVATGIRANLDLVQGTAIQTDRGILVNDRMQTNIPHVYAAGDVAQGPDLLGGPPAVHAIQPTAVDHGRIAGANMAGQEVHYPGSLLMNILDVCGLQCVSYGRWAEEDDMTICNPDRPLYRRLLWTGPDARIIGAIFVGPANDVGMLNDVGMVKGIIQTRTPLGQWKQFLRENPFDIRRPYIAARVAEKLVNSTLLGRPSKARQYRSGNVQAAPQVTEPVAHRDFVQTKGPEGTKA
jgi:NAD(P)H-nitrite reductase large subunit